MSDPPVDLPIEINPQTAAQLSVDAPPVDDPEFEPANSKELASALQVLAQKLPDRLAGSVYRKFEEYVAKHAGEGIGVLKDMEEEKQSDEIAERLRIFKKMLEG